MPLSPSSNTLLSSRLRNSLPNQYLSKTLTSLPDDVRLQPRTSISTWTTDRLPLTSSKRLSAATKPKDQLSSTITLFKSSLSNRGSDHLSSPSNVELLFADKSPTKPRINPFLQDDASPPLTHDKKHDSVEDKPALRVTALAAAARPSGGGTPSDRLRAARTLVRSCADFRIRAGRDAPELCAAHDLKRARWYAINCLMGMQERALAGLGGPC